MTQEEFVKLHGKKAWEEMVKPREESRYSEDCYKGQWAGIVHHSYIGPTLRLLGFKNNSLLEAELFIKEQRLEKELRESKTESRPGEIQGDTGWR